MVPKDAEIIRIRSHSNFTIIPNALLTDTRLSARALGLMCHILHYPDSWKFNKTILYKNFAEGRDAIIKAWDELEKVGYITSETYYKGNIKAYRYTIRDVAPVTGSPAPENPEPAENLGFSVPENPELKTRSYINTNKESTIKQDSFIIVSDETIINGPGVGDSPNAANAANNPTPPGCAPPPAPAKQKKPYELVLDVWYRWYESRNDGIPPMVNGVQINAAKAINTYLRTVVKKKNPELEKDEAAIVDKTVESIQFVFKYWDKLDDFTQRQVQLHEISSRISNIINYLRNELDKAKQHRSQSGHNSTNDAVNERISQLLRGEGGNAGGL